MTYRSLSELFEPANNRKIKKVNMILDPGKDTRYDNQIMDIYSLIVDSKKNQENSDFYIEITDNTQNQKIKYGTFQSEKIDTIEDLITIVKNIANNLKLYECEVFMHSEPYDSDILDKIYAITNPEGTTKRLLIIHE